ncbi:LuxR C-terminal-related transcriptional regulator [Kribbella sp. NPDC051770]|uniref:helix-turn-helix transcriptional regulator n=1 Tax=Kribbella sp. NPDC051770 TaxID=3155413 RepID=UPI00343BD4AF
MDAVLGRATALDPRDREAVEKLSVVPWPVDLDFAERLLGNGFTGLAAAEAHGLLELSSGTVRFRHEIARRAIEEAIPRIRRIAMHRAVVTTLLAGAEPDSAAVVHHAVQGFDARTIVRFAPGAARQAARAGSHRQALICFEAVVPLVDTLEAGEQADLLDDYGWELHLALRFDDAVGAARRAVGVRERIGAVVPWIETLLRLSRHLYMAGQTATARSTIERAEELAGRCNSAEARAATMTYRSMILVQTGLLDDAIALLPEARAAAVRADRPDLASLCSNYLGVALTDTGDEGGLAHLRDALAGALDSGRHEAAARAYTNLAEVLFRHNRTDELVSLLEAGARFTQDHGFWSHAFGLEVHEIHCSLRRGNWNDAERRLQTLLGSTPDPGMLAVYSRPIAARLRLRTGRMQDAYESASTTWDQAWSQQSLVGILYGGVAYAEWAWVAGRADVAQEIHDQLAQYDIPAGLLESFDQIHRLLGLAGVDVKSSESVAARPGASLDPYERAAALASSGSVGDALQALGILDTLGATAPADDLRRQLRRLRIASIPARPVGGSGGSSLTRRQVEVLRLLGTGLTNAEIAARLVVSARTVDHHVSAILNRLGAGTRRDAVRRATDIGLLETSAG